MTRPQQTDMHKDIERYDIVAVNFNGSKYTLSSRAEVMRMPMAAGDSWVFHDIESHAIHHVSEGCTITLIERKDANRLQ